MLYKKDIMKKEVYLPVLGFVIGELNIVYGNVSYGLGIHIINLLAIILISIFGQYLKIKNTLQGIVLLTLLQIISLSVPQLFTDINIQFLLPYGIMFIPIYYIAKQTSKEPETNPMEFHILVIILIIGVIMQIFQYNTFYSNLEITDISGKFATVYLLISIIITLLLTNTKYWNKCVSDILNMSSSSLLPILILTLIFNVTSTT